MAARPPHAAAAARAARYAARTCVECGAPIPVDAHGHRLTCGADCMHKRRYRKAFLVHDLRRKAIRYAEYFDRPTRPCVECGAPIPGIHHGNRNHCSDDCVRDDLNRRRSERRARRKTERPTRPCVECGAPIPGAQHANRRYCGPDCAERAGREHQRTRRLIARYAPDNSADANALCQAKTP